MTEPQTPKYTRLEACHRFVASVRHSTEIGMFTVSAEEDCVRARLPWREDLVGNPEVGALHGGAVFTFLDQVGGLANICKLYPRFDVTPTIDFRLDHLCAAAPGRAIIGEGRCYRVTGQVLFVRLDAWEEDDKGEPGILVASGLATYARIAMPDRGKAMLAEGKGQGDAGDRA